MLITWVSRKGLKKLKNNDAVALYENDEIFIAIAVDAAEKNNISHESGLAKYWANTVIAECKLRIDSTSMLKIDINEIVAILREKQKNLRHSYLHETASYAVVFWDKELQVVTTLHCGDCLFGKQKNALSIRWLIKPHNTYQQHLQLLAADCQCNSHAYSRFTLTRHLNAKRFYTPELNEFPIIDIEKLVLSTDGYWAEHIDECVIWEELEDDASVLMINFSEEKTLDIQSDCENFSAYSIY
ncbi:hypothetical protein [Yersinia ruckeri]|uniref:Uncharacterized protein n=1 Tax=Yersinia ruckeri TaxID=29486 RepID=A0A0A8VK43_YERRU|nr:hypothetical protein [Yersinia ruckeri]EEP97642.1 hypothetical protein yruck0001_31860 [Yersinia ruckeri ATCC 29473]KGA51271.1 hypothetical protein DJ39_2169 [Yersinia ruckeri ATCC 29473]MCK8594461.1 hypothetical protein [Yersinia ruckeri]MCK8597658.1 hypothetical protein [Yersinia ruckeri]MCW6610232.1 hypothetical protein [Yersinia ruckeri]